MTNTRVLSRAVLTASVVISILAATPVSAQRRRARLSSDLADALNRGTQLIDVIVHGDRATVDAIAARYNLRVKRYLKSGGVLRVNAGQLAAVRDDGAFDHLSPDVPIYSSDVTTETIAADRVWAGDGDLQRLTGSGVGVAVIDSGVDPQHTALTNRVAVSVDFTGGNGVDRFGHGTHVAAIIAGQRGRAADTQDYRGVASSARIINLRVLGEDGSGLASSVIEAIDWAIEFRERYNIKVINLSLGAPVTQPYRDDPLCEAAERAVAAGIVVVTAAGNYGQTKDGRRVYGSVASPGNDPHVVTVGALDAHATADRSDDTVALYSSRGPTMYDLVMKPDVVAPGSHVVSAEAPGSYIATHHPERHVAGAGEGAYIQLSGTSMATAVASGTIALLFDQRPSLSPNDAKVALQLTSTLMPEEGLLASGAGSINAFAAAEFVAGSYTAAMAAALTDGELPAPTSNFGSHSGVNAQHVTIHPTSSATPRKIVFGTTRHRGRLVLWGKTVVGDQTFAWGRTLVTKPSWSEQQGT